MIEDLTPKESFAALHQMRHSKFPELALEDNKVFWDALKLTGGRLAYMNRVARAKDMQEQVATMLVQEKSWLLSQIGLIPDHDDDVMDEVRP